MGEINNLKQDIEYAKTLLSKKYSSEIFNKIYPFTTENIAGYINEFDLEEKSLLTVGSSLDQSINASLLGCKNQTLIDLCRFSKYYFYLKKAALLSLDLEEYIEFFKYRDDFGKEKDNDSAFNLKSFAKLVQSLKIENEESYYFWVTLFNSFNQLDIRKYLFIVNEHSVKEITTTNLYLKNKTNYQQTKEHIKSLYPKFIMGNIYETVAQQDLTDKFDNIFLSNIADYNHIQFHEELTRTLFAENLNLNGQILSEYMYGLFINPEECFPQSMNNRVITFQGIEGIVTGREDFDSVRIFKKI